MSFGATIGAILCAMIFMVISIYVFEKQTTESIKEIDAFIESQCAKMDGGTDNG